MPDIPRRSGNTRLTGDEPNSPCVCGSQPPSVSADKTTVAVQSLLHDAYVHHQNGRLQQAEIGCQRVLQVAPLQADALHLLGLIAHQLGKRESAVDFIRRAVGAKPRDQNFRFNLGYMLREQGKLAEAASAYGEALALVPDPDAFNNLGIVFREQGKLDEAINCYRQALTMKPGFADAHCNLGNALREQGQLREATDCYLRALQFGHGASAKTGFVQCIKDISFTSFEPAIYSFVIRAIEEAWIRPAELWVPALSLVRLNLVVNACIGKACSAWPKRLGAEQLFGTAVLGALAEERLLHSVLAHMPNMNMETERFLTMARYILLGFAMNEADPTQEKTSALAEPDPLQLSFFCALARQCFINEYVFACTDREANLVEQLRGKLTQSFANSEPISLLSMTAFAAYYPLNTLPFADTLLTKSWPAVFSALLIQQIREPLIEQAYATSMPRKTAIAEGVSRKVQTQYEENPYPRWVDATQDIPTNTVNTYFAKLFPLSSFRPIDAEGGVDILIAGCGTGQHSIHTARTFRGARVLAIDLSLASLSYAKRKSAELGLKNIEYAQADILNIGEIQQRFDIVESVGVLHHLVDPVIGWRALLPLVRPGGLMQIGLYSELARRTVVAARQYISQRQYGCRAEDIRQCRQDLMALETAEQFRQLQLMGDFYATSSCRDLLFHIQEHRFTVLQLKAILIELHLVFIGFKLQPATARDYLRRFPSDSAMTDLDNWHIFETDHPDTFANMYQFWVQKIN